MISPARSAEIIWRPDWRPEGIRVPRTLDGLDAFRAWTLSDAFPESGRIDWIDGTVEIDMSPEDLNAHGTPKVAISGDLRALVEAADRGVVLSDRFRITSPEANLSAEPDVVVVLFDTVRSGRARLVPRMGGRPGYVEIEGAPDIVVECVSDSSTAKDKEELPETYFRAGIPEYWLVDARLDPPALALLRRGADRYEAAPAGPDGFARSDVLGREVRLVRRPEVLGIVRYRLELRSASI